MDEVGHWDRDHGGLKMNPQKTCRTCGGDYDVAFFAPKRATCIGCVQTARDRKKWRELRFPSKVQWARRSHARRLHRSAAELRLRYGWTDAAMMRDARDVWWNGCPCCRRPVCRIGYGGGAPTHFQAEHTSPDDGARIPPLLSNLVLRIRDRQADPTYGTNTLWLCRFCAWAVVGARGPAIPGGGAADGGDGRDKGDRAPAASQARRCRHCHELFEPVNALAVFCKPSCRIQHLAPKLGQQRALPLGDAADLFAVPFEDS